jgi:hypothetical protein
MLICNRSYLPGALEGWRRRATKRGLHIAMWDCVMTLFGPTVLVAPAPPPFYLRLTSVHYDFSITFAGKLSCFQNSRTPEVFGAQLAF